MSQLYAGLISGTSLDGIDAALVDFSTPQPKIIATHIHPLPDSTKNKITTAFQQWRSSSLDAIGELDQEVAALFAEATVELLRQANITSAQVTAIGSHGITLRHAPDLERPFSWQLGDPNIIAEITGMTTVADFRRRDMAAGGQGAPLLPALHHALFRSDAQSRAVLNLGGIANLTVLPKEKDQPVLGFDSGTANGLMDAWILHHQGKPYDDNGAWARQGKINQALLQKLLADPYFDRDIPKSTGREYFNLDWIKQHTTDEAPEDVQATLVELSAITITRALARWAPDTKSLLVCGGGAYNPFLIERIQAHLGDIKLESTATYGLPPEWVEAVGFAWLAKQTLNKNAGNMPTVTGAIGPRILGGVYFSK